MTLVLRPAVAADRPELAAMLGEVVDEFARMAPGGWPGQPDQAALWATAGLGFSDNPVCQTLLPEVDGRIAGYLAWHMGVWEIYASLFVAGLYVRPWARRRQVGRALMAEAGRLGAARGATHMAWMVWRLNQPAQDFYHSLGAEIFDDNMQMFLKLPPPTPGS